MCIANIQIYNYCVGIRILDQLLCGWIIVYSLNLLLVCLHGLDMFLLQDHVKRQTRFVSRQPAEVIISTIESVAESMTLKVHKHNYKVFYLSFLLS